VLEKSLDSTVLSFSDGSIVFLNGEEETNVSELDVFGGVPVGGIMFDLELNIEMFTHQCMF